ncbi:hypothetical protein Tco_0685636 [Tanacetum coccineum]
MSHGSKVAKIYTNVSHGLLRSVEIHKSRKYIEPNLTMNSSTIVSKIHPTCLNGLRRLLQLQKVVLKQLQKGIDNDIYSTVDACPNACEMWKAIERLKQGNTHDLGSFGEEMYEITYLHQILEEVLLTECGDGVASIKRRLRDLFSDGV